MQSLKVALAFIRVPRLFISLLLIPAFIGVILIAFQVLGTLVMIELAQKSKNAPSEENVSEKNKDPASLVRILLYGSADPLPQILVCRWIIESQGERKREIPPSPDCNPARLDVAMRSDSPDTFDASRFERILNGNVQRLHICRTCRPDVIIEDSLGSMKTHATSIWGLTLISLTQFNTSIEEHRVKMRESRIEADSLVGEIFFYAWGLNQPVALSESIPLLALIFNVASIVLLALWLALKAHRKVLLLFSRSGALLPLVAGLGQRTFYGSLWWITSFRVIFFLAGAIPLSVLGIMSLEQEASITLSALCLWIVSLILSFGLATLIASIADLKERQGVSHLAYLYVPLLVSALGGIMWCATFLLDSELMGYLRWLLTVLPLVGMVPLLLAPLLSVPLWCLALHGLLAVCTASFFNRKNSTWFASHLEEV
jgi:hypothetical protein